MSQSDMDYFNNIVKWLAGTGIGSSSKFMACVALGLEYEDRFDRAPHPHDPDDLNRCLKLLKAAPEVRESFDKIAAASPYWAALIPRWDDLETAFLDEAGLDWCKTRSAKKTYALMRSILDPIQDADESVMRFGAGSIKFKV